MLLITPSGHLLYSDDRLLKLTCHAGRKINTLLIYPKEPKSKSNLNQRHTHVPTVHGIKKILCPLHCFL